VKRILVVDDDPDILDALRQALTEAYEVLVAQNGQEALDVLAIERVDAIVLDLMMPILDGVAVLQRLREDGCSIPVVIVSAGSDVARVARRHGVRDYFAKPFDLIELEQTLARLVGSGGKGPGGSRPANDSSETSGSSGGRGAGCTPRAPNGH
jgi:two-component system response regulator MprA